MLVFFSVTAVVLSARKKRVNAWLRARDYPSMPLPSVCGYSPMMTRVYELLMKRGL